MDQERIPDQVKELQPEWTYLACSCCRKIIENTPEQNVAFGQEPYPYAEGKGMCFECGGNPTSDDIQAKLGRVGQMFFDVRIRRVREYLKPSNRARFEAMPYERQIGFIGNLIDSGVII